MQDVLTEIGVWKERGDRIALATVIAVQRSAPRPPGAKMAVNSRGEIAGSVSGGCVEGAVAEIADGVLKGDPPQLLHFGIADSDAWDVGLPCGGEISIWVERYEPDSLAQRFSTNVRQGVRSAIVTALEGVPQAGAKLLVEADGDPARAGGTLGDDELDAAARKLADEAMWSERSELQDHQGAKLFIDTSAPKPRLIIVGAVDFAAQLSEIAALADWR